MHEPEHRQVLSEALRTVRMEMHACVRFQERGAMLSEVRAAVHGEKSMRCAGRCAVRLA